MEGADALTVSVENPPCIALPVTVIEGFVGKDLFNVPLKLEVSKLCSLKSAN